MILNRKPIVLLVDDDRQIQELLHDYLESHGFRVLAAGEGRQMQRILERNKVDLVVLDIMLPGEDGISLCKKLRAESDVLIIMLSAVGEETDRVVGLEMGADDYLTKPFSPRELLARIKALMRRKDGRTAAASAKGVLAPLSNICFLNWKLDRNRRQLIAPDGVAMPLSAGEYTLLLAFLEHSQRVLSRDILMDLTQGRQAEAFDRAIDVQVGRLRKKIEADPKHPQIIITVRGGGYQFMAEVTEEENKSV